MKVEFIRTGQRRYAVRIHRDNSPSLIMDPAPGFDPDLPHDMVHFVVEAELGLAAGLFGQLAAGGTAGSFHVEAADNGGSTRHQARERKKVARKGQAMLRAARDTDISEIAAAVFDTEWRSRRSGAAPPPQVANEMRRLRATLSVEEARSFSRAEAAILSHFDQLCEWWRGLREGQSLILGWPTLSRHS